MAVQEFDTEGFARQLDNAKQLLERSAELGAELSDRGYDTLVFVGCGAPNRIVRLIQHYADLMAVNAIRSYLPAEFVHINPSHVGENTAVVFGSYSGTTKETVQAAVFCKNKPCLTISITRFDDSPLAKEVEVLLNYGDTRLGDYSRFMVTSALVSGFLSAREPEKWSFHDRMMQSLRSLPETLAEVVKQSEDVVCEFSKTYQEISSVLVVGHGPIYNVAYVLAFCSYMEMQWMHATPVIAAEFFHGPFEILDDSIPVIVLVGEDETRKEGERVVSFCQEHLTKYTAFDSKNYHLTGLDPELRSYFSGVVLDAATRRLMDYAAEYRGHDKSRRRYMGVIDY